METHTDNQEMIENHQLKIKLDAEDHENTINQQNKVAPSHDKQVHALKAHREPQQRHNQWLTRNDGTEQSNNPIFTLAKPKSSPVMPMQRLRMMMEPRSIKSRSTDNFYSGPMLKTCLDQISKQNPQYFSTLCFRQGYYQLNLQKTNKHMICFTMIGGKSYQYKAMVMSKKDGAKSPNRMIQQVFRGCQNIVTYLDDVLIVKQTLEAHEQANGRDTQ
jgi:hypothetical protein